MASPRPSSPTASSGWPLRLVAWFAVAETRDLDKRPRRDGAQAIPFAEQMRSLARQRGFVLVSIIALMNAVARTGGLFTIVPVLANVKLGISVSAIGFAMMLGSLAGLVAAYPAGWLTDRFGRKSVIVPATLITGTSMLLFSVAPGYGWFVAASIVWGIAISVGSSAPTAYAADSAPPGMNAAAISAFRMTSDAGYVLGPLVLGLIVDSLWRRGGAGGGLRPGRLGRHRLCDRRAGVLSRRHLMCRRRSRILGEHSTPILLFHGSAP